jgi:phosphopantothenoylcysteine decarboxylase
MNLLIGVTGSVATIKLVDLVNLIKERNPTVDIKIVFTENSKHFINNLILSTIENLVEKFHSDSDEWESWSARGDPVLHIELRKWLDVLLIAPLSANTLAKISNGICDNLLTSVVRAFDVDKRLIVAPAMNTFMYENPITKRQLDSVVETYGAEIIPPKLNYQLICGDVGSGAMADLNDIVDRIFKV